LTKPLATTAINIEQAVSHFNILSQGITNPQARFAVLINSGKGRQTKPLFIPVNDDALKQVLDNIREDILNKNIYISVNTFYTNSATQEHLHKLNFLIVDIDWHTDTIPTEHDIAGLRFYLEEEFFGSKTPAPTMIVSTGRGLHLYWKIKTMSYNPKNKMFWKRVEQALIEQFNSLDFNEFEVDSKVSNPNRVLRLAGTNNPKAGRLAEIVYLDDNEYTLTEIWQGYLADSKVTTKIEYTEAEENSLLGNRLADLEKLISLRKGYMDGHRQFTIWVARIIMQQLGYSQAKLSARLNSINASFAEALPQSEIDHEISRNDIYAFTNDYLISQLKITAKEQKSLKSILGTKEKRNRIAETRAKEAQRRREERAASKEIYLSLVKDYVNEGYSQAQIAGILGVSIRSVKEYYKQLGLDMTIKSNRQDILSLKKQGYTPKQVAKKLNISMSTVRAHWNKSYK